MYCRPRRHGLCPSLASHRLRRARGISPPARRSGRGASATRAWGRGLSGSGKSGTLESGRVSGRDAAHSLSFSLSFSLSLSLNLSLSLSLGVREGLCFHSPRDSLRQASLSRATKQLMPTPRGHHSTSSLLFSSPSPPPPSPPPLSPCALSLSLAPPRGQVTPGHRPSKHMVR